MTYRLQTLRFKLKGKLKILLFETKHLGKRVISKIISIIRNLIRKLKKIAGYGVLVLGS